MLHSKLSLLMVLLFLLLLSGIDSFWQKKSQKRAKKQHCSMSRRREGLFFAFVGREGSLSLLCLEKGALNTSGHYRAQSRLNERKRKRFRAPFLWMSKETDFSLLYQKSEKGRKCKSTCTVLYRVYIRHITED